MNDYYHVCLESKNVKTGPMVVVTSSSETCPDTCPFKEKGCYGKSGPLNIHWRKVSNGERGLSFTELLTTLRGIPR
jgi:hypothetical protein